MKNQAISQGHAKLLLICCLTLLAVYGCVTGQAASPPAPLALGPNASGSSFTLQPDQKLAISLPANPSTGFDWHVVKHDSSLLTLLEDDYVAPENARIGQGGEHRFVFQARQRGSTVLELAYYRPWEGTDKAEDWYQLIVEIR